MVHPDGLILGSGTTDGMVRIWDIKSQQNVVSFTGHGGAIGSLCFSENGYYCATTGADGCKVPPLHLRRMTARPQPYTSYRTHRPETASPYT